MSFNLRLDIHNKRDVTSPAVYGWSSWSTNAKIGLVVAILLFSAFVIFMLTRLYQARKHMLREEKDLEAAIRHVEERQRRDLGWSGHDGRGQSSVLRDHHEAHQESSNRGRGGLRRSRRVGSIEHLDRDEVGSAMITELANMVIESRPWQHLLGEVQSKTSESGSVKAVTGSNMAGGEQREARVVNENTPAPSRDAYNDHEVGETDSFTEGDSDLESDGACRRPTSHQYRLKPTNQWAGLGGAGRVRVVGKGKNNE